VFATHDDPGYCQAFPCVNHLPLAALVNSVPGMGSRVMNIAVLGAGAMGCLFGGRLAEAGHRVALIDIRRELIEAIDRDGLVLEDAAGGTRVHDIAAALTAAGPGCEVAGEVWAAIWESPHSTPR
jgi:NADPH-dependent 2,4-dienoyl-CoA reductase/sulfur reductase-like enzyme